jgi:uncharacterized protein with PIN domain
MKTSREKLKAEYMAEAEALFDEMMVWDEQTQKPDLTQIEEIVLQLRKRFGEQLAQQVLLRQEQRQPAEKVACPECGQAMASKGLKENQVETRIGNLKLERGYYYCPQCKQGFFPPGSAVAAVGETME